MTKLILLALSCCLLNFAHAEGLEGKVATLGLELKGLIQNKEVLTVSAEIKSSAFSSGLYFEPKNKLVLLEVPDNCLALVQLAFVGNFKFSIRGELKKFHENYTSASEVAFNEKSAIRCEVIKGKDQ